MTKVIIYMEITIDSADEKIQLFCLPIEPPPKWSHDMFLDDDVATTEILNFDGTITAGPNLPEPRHSHCMASFANTVLIIGKL